MSILYFLAACAGIVLLGWTVSKITGAKAYYIEDWSFDAGEQILWQDEAADIYPLSHYGRALVESFARMRRGMVVVTDRRVLGGARPLFGKKHLLQYMLYPIGSVPDQSGSRATQAGASLADSKKMHGGLLTRGYQTLLIQPGGLSINAGEKKPYVEIVPVQDAASSTNLRAIRIYTDQAASFTLPGSH